MKKVGGSPGFPGGSQGFVRFGRVSHGKQNPPKATPPHSFQQDPLPTTPKMSKKEKTLEGRLTRKINLFLNVIRR